MEAIKFYREGTASTLQNLEDQIAIFIEDLPCFDLVRWIRFSNGDRITVVKLTNNMGSCYYSLGCEQESGGYRQYIVYGHKTYLDYKVHEHGESDAWTDQSDRSTAEARLHIDIDPDPPTNIPFFLFGGDDYFFGIFEFSTTDIQSLFFGQLSCIDPTYTNAKAHIGSTNCLSADCAPSKFAANGAQGQVPGSNETYGSYLRYDAAWEDIGLVPDGSFHYAKFDTMIRSASVEETIGPPGAPLRRTKLIQNMGTWTWSSIRDIPPCGISLPILFSVSREAVGWVPGIRLACTLQLQAGSIIRLGDFSFHTIIGTKPVDSKTHLYATGDTVIKEPIR